MSQILCIVFNSFYMFITLAGDGKDSDIPINIPAMVYQLALGAVTVLIVLSLSSTSSNLIDF